MVRKMKTLILDSSQIAQYLTCPSKWHFGSQLHLEPAEFKESKVAMNMGTYGHKLLEVYYKFKHLGIPKASEIALDYPIDKEVCRCGHGTEHHPEPHEYQDGCKVISCMCEKFEPMDFPLSTEDRLTVTNRFIDYTAYEGYVVPHMTAKSPDHLEVGFAEEIYKDDNYQFILEGRIDFIGSISDQAPIAWADHKFQTKGSYLFNKSIQFRNYSMVQDLTIGAINYIRLADKLVLRQEPKKYLTFERDVISFSRAELRAWRSNLAHIFKDVQDAMDKDEWLNPDDSYRNRSQCGVGWGGHHCAYAKLCNEFVNPELIKIMMDTEYRKRPVWRPW